MKTLLMSGLSILMTLSAFLNLSTTTAYASGNKTVTPGACVVNPTDVGTVLIASIDEQTTLAKANVVTAGRVTCEDKQPGVTEYKFFYYNCAMCSPQREGVLTVEQDLRPTYADGAPIYKKHLIIQEEVR